MKKLLIPIIILLIIAGCSPTQQSVSTNRNVAGLYLPNINLLNPDFELFNLNDSVSKLYFKVNSQNILYARKNNDTAFSANVAVKYVLYQYPGETIIDSATILFKDYEGQEKYKSLEGDINLKTPQPLKYKIDIRVIDLNKSQFFEKTLFLNKENKFNAHNFLLLDTNLNVLFNKTVKLNQPFYIRKTAAVNNPSVRVKFYPSSNKIAKPPFSIEEETVNIQADSLFYLTFDEEGLIKITPNDYGIYHFQYTENLDIPGLSVLIFEDNFPHVLTTENMLYPLRYITSKKEFEDIKNAEILKKAIDEFWIKLGGSNQRAKTLIKEYYSRVETANELFTSFTEGWKTDRGMIYIVFGPPNIVYKGKKAETWIYGEENNIMSIHFMFYKVENPLTDNDYYLDRSPVFKSTWYRAVDSWRNGRIY
jgi:GWxTD domain-containing protein